VVECKHDRHGTRLTGSLHVVREEPKKVDRYFVTAKAQLPPGTNKVSGCYVSIQSIAMDKSVFSTFLTVFSVPQSKEKFFFFFF